MSTDFILPDIGEGIVECEVVEWLVEEGETIKEDQPICEVMTDKAMVEIPAKSDGVISKRYYQKGEIAIVGKPLFAIQEAGSENTQPAEQTASASNTVKAESSAATVAVSNATSSSNSSIEDFILPDIGEGIVECEVVAWLVEEGDVIKEDQAVCEVMTDKAMVEIPAKSDGVVSKMYYAKGDIAIVGKPLFAITVEGAAQNTVAQSVKVEEVKSEQPAVQLVANGGELVATSGKKAVASPAVRRRAREMNIDITLVPGSGAKGRVYKEDLVTFQNGGAATKSVANETTNALKPSTQTGGSRVEPIRGIKAAMAKAMQDSVSTIPHFTFSDEIDLTELVKLRKKLKPEYEAQGVKLTMMPFFMKALSMAIRQFPVMNSQPNADCTELTYFDDHNIGMAVDSKVGLLVPNIKGCQSLSIKDIAVKVMEMTDQARAGRLSPTQLKGGTISISNIGALGGTTATPIINKPEVAIVALGKMQTLPRFNANGEVEARQIMNVSWSGDHRVIDGGTIARFNNLWTRYLQDPAAMMMEMV